MSQPEPAYLFYLIDGLEPAVPIEIVDANNRRVFIVEDDYMLSNFVEFFVELPLFTNYQPALLRLDAPISAQDRQSGFAELDEIVEALRLFCRGHAQPVARVWVCRDKWKEYVAMVEAPHDSSCIESATVRGEKLEKARSRLGILPETLPHTLFPEPNPIRLDKAACLSFPEFWRQWRALDKSGVREALDAFKRVSSITNEMKVTALVQCIEGLLSEGPGDLKHKVSIRGAFLMERDSSRRPAFFKLLKRAYDVRSCTVHAKGRAQLDKDLKAMEKTMEEPLEKVVLDLENRVRELLRDVALRTRSGDRSHFLEKVDAALLAHRDSALL